ncbi:hypothetical protein [Fictibacillus fluitans]|uniref:YfhD family protein n=1 Tax=Fictibacillus fluitans TaxID=3058422 RepID=A0ABT8HUF3_9BACL|nr:hypothetical protein [Fictibacillus sp. NE201]MDN4524379.1 hypothetical protein [Fictibacillus sp. NE201]
MAENEKRREQNAEQRKRKADIPKGTYADPIANQGDIAEIKNVKDSE